MKSPLCLLAPPFLAFLLAGCASPQRAYRDPLSYSFEQKETPPQVETEWHDVKGKVKATSKKIRSWEDRYLW